MSLSHPAGRECDNTQAEERQGGFGGGISFPGAPLCATMPGE